MADENERERPGSGSIELRLGLQQDRAVEVEALVLRLLAPLSGTERVLDSGCGIGAFALAIAPHVGSVVGIDANPDYLDAARSVAPPNVEFVEGDAAALPFEYGEFDIVGCMRVLHHVRRPELVVGELVRVTGPGGRILIVDQLGDVDPIRSVELDRFERARDASHTRSLPDGDIRALLDVNDLVVVSNEIVREHRDVERFLDLAGLAPEAKDRIRRLAPAPHYDVEVGWYAARKR